MTISTKLSSNNFLRQFRSDENSGELGKLSSVQFMEVWEHYDKDGNVLLNILTITIKYSDCGIRYLQYIWNMYTIYIYIYTFRILTHYDLAQKMHLFFGFFIRKISLSV